MRFLISLLLLNFVLSQQCFAKAITIIAFGDSLVAGYGVEPEHSFPKQLEQKLKQEYDDLQVINAGITGDTSAGGKSRIDFVIKTHQPDICIIVLGGNDMLRGIPPKYTKENLSYIITALQKHGTKIILTSMVAGSNLGLSYKRQFDTIYPALAKEYDITLSPFFLEGVYGKPNLMLHDGIHPNKQGISHITEKIAPLVKEQIK